jgi:glutathione-regulated potassium-efflux system ancillary protein KefC
LWIAGGQHDGRLGARITSVGACADCEPAADLVAHLVRAVVGTIGHLIIGAAVGSAVLGTDESWIKFLSGIGAIVLTFLAGAQLDPIVFRLKWKEAAAIGLISFLFPLLGCAAAAHYLLG